MRLWKCYTQQASKFWKQQWPQHWKWSVFIPSPKKGNAKECSNYPTGVHISHASKVMVRNFQARLQQYMKRELTDIQAGLRKGRWTRDLLDHWKGKRVPEKNIYFCFMIMSKPLTFGLQQTGNFFKRWIPDHLTCLQKNLCAGQEATVRTGHGTTSLFQIWKVCQGCILSPCLLNLYAEYIMGNTGLDDA